MNHPTPSFFVVVDTRNPGQFFGCCGLLELAYRLWPDMDGWFDVHKARFNLSSKESSATLQGLIEELSGCEIYGLSEEERQERKSLEDQVRQLKRHKIIPPDELENRRKELGASAREGVICLGKPFDLILDWWRTDDTNTMEPKTWAGLQEIHKIARAAQDCLSGIAQQQNLFEHGCVMRNSEEYRKSKADQNKCVEPFYFDARRFAHPLDTGFSLDVQDAEAIAYPATELLSLIGLQRFRPVASAGKWIFEYLAWSIPLSPLVASAAVCCAVPAPGSQFQFNLRFRDNQKRYKAFGFATYKGGQK